MNKCIKLLLHVAAPDVSPLHPFLQVPVLLLSTFLSSLQLLGATALFSAPPSHSTRHYPHSWNVYQVVDGAGKVAAGVIEYGGCSAGRYLSDWDL